MHSLSSVGLMRLRPTLALTLLLALYLLPASLLPLLELDNSPEAYFAASSPTVVFHADLRETFPGDQVLIALFEGDDLFQDTFLGRLDAVVQRLQRHPRVDRVLAVSTVDHVRGSEDGFAVETLLDAEAAAPLSERERIERVLQDRFAPGLLVARDGSAIAVVVRPRALENSLQRIELEQALRDAAQAEGLTAHLTAVSGAVALDAALLRAMIRDTMVFVPVTLSLGMLLVWWLFRRALAVIVTVLVIGAVVNSTIALLVLAGKPYTLISAILPSLMSALSIALLIHWFNAITHAARSGLAGRARVERALSRVARPALYTALTTSAGLSSLAFSPIQPIKAFGLVAAAGVLILVFVVVVLVPPLFERWDQGDWAGRRRGIRRLDGAVRRLRNLGMRRSGWVLVTTGALLALGTPQILKIQAETDMFRFFDAAHPISESTRRIQASLSGVTSLEVVFDGAHRDSFKEPGNLRLVRDLQRFLDARPEVDRSVSLVDLIEEMHWAFHEEDPAYRMLPDSAPLISQYLLIYDGRDLHELVDREFQRTRILLSLNINGARAINALIDEIEAHAATLDTGAVDVAVSGFGRLFADQEKLLIQGQIRGLIAAIVLISVIMLILWRSATDAAVSMVPNLAPILVIFIAMGLFGIWLDEATAMIASVTVGIAVDDTIHVFHGYRQRRAAGASPVWALARTYQHAGRAVTATTLILCLQFLILGTSQFVPTAEFGILTAFGLLAALVFDLLVLPALVIVLLGCRRRHKPPATPIR